MEEPFFINIEFEQYKSVSYICLIAGVEPLDSCYRLEGSLLVLLAISEIILG